MPSLNKAKEILPTACVARKGHASNPRATARERNVQLAAEIEAGLAGGHAVAVACASRAKGAGHAKVAFLSYIIDTRRTGAIESTGRDALAVP